MFHLSMLIQICLKATSKNVMDEYDITTIIPKFTCLTMHHLKGCLSTQAFVAKGQKSTNMRPSSEFSLQNYHSNRANRCSSFQRLTEVFVPSSQSAGNACSQFETTLLRITQTFPNQFDTCSVSPAQEERC